MQQAKQGQFNLFDASDWKLGIVVAQFNKSITDQLKHSALQRASEYQMPSDNITVVDVAGAVEIPLVLQILAKTGKYNALLAIGCVIKGATPHFDFVCSFVTDGVLRVQLDHNIPIGFGILTCNNESEAQERANIGGDHLDAVMHQTLAIHKLS